MDMKTPGTIAGVAALAAGGVLLASQMQKRHLPEGGTLTHLTHDTLRHLAPRVTVEEDVHVRMPKSSMLTWAALLGIGGLIYSQMGKSKHLGMGMRSPSTVEQSIDVDVPVSTAYNQWTQFEEFPRFMDTIEHVKQLDDTHLHWRANIGGKIKEWDAEITEQVPDQRIAWRSTSGTQNSGVVTFHRIGENKTRVMLQMDYRPETADEKIGGALGGVKLLAKGNLARFKELIERRGTETGAWRGTVPQH